jgi:hypothetical protein
MLMQSHHDLISVFPAIPGDWENVSFEDLRARGAFLVSAVKNKGKIVEVRVLSENGGLLKIKNPFGKNRIKVSGAGGVRIDNDGTVMIKTIQGQKITLTSLEKKSRTK